MLQVTTKLRCASFDCQKTTTSCGVTQMSFFSEVQLDDKFGPFEVLKNDCGFIPNLFRAQSLLPRVIEAEVNLEETVLQKDGAISRVQKDRILLSVAGARNDRYCLTLASNALASLGAQDGQVYSLLNDYRHAGLSGADVALLDFCLKLSCDALSMSLEDVEGLRRHGFGDESIIEAIVTTALAVFRCTLSAGLGPEPDFVPRDLPSLPTTTPPRMTVQGSLRGIHQAQQKKGPFVRAPYISKTFAPFAALSESRGFIPNFFRSQTLRPDLLVAEVEALGAIFLPEDILTRVQKECILLVVSAANLNSYCVAAHCNVLRGLGMSPEEGDQIAVDHHQSGLSEADKALLDFAVRLGAHFSEFSGDDVIRMRALGFKEEQILECEVVTAFNNFVNTIQMGLGIEPDFEPPLAFQEKMHLSAAMSTPIVEDSVLRSSTTAIEEPDADLVAKAQAGDLVAFEVLVRRHSRTIYRALVAILGNLDDAQDAMQDALLSAFKHIAQFQGRSKFSTWLVSIARNAALQRLGSRKNVESLDEAGLDDEQEFRPHQVQAWQDNPEQSYSRSEIRQLVERGIMALPGKYRVVVTLRDIECLSADEVARQLGLTVPAVKVRLLRGRLMLREWLSPYLAAGSRRAAQ